VVGQNYRCSAYARPKRRRKVCEPKPRGKLNVRRRIKHSSNDVSIHTNYACSTEAEKPIFALFYALLHSELLRAAPACAKITFLSFSPLHLHSVSNPALSYHCHPTCVFAILHKRQCITVIFVFWCVCVLNGTGMGIAVHRGPDADVAPGSANPRPRPAPVIGSGAPARRLPCACTVPDPRRTLIKFKVTRCPNIAKYSVLGQTLTLISDGDAAGDPATGPATGSTSLQGQAPNPPS